MLAGDKVLVEISPYDLSRGRITYERNANVAHVRAAAMVPAAADHPSTPGLLARGFLWPLLLRAGSGLELAALLHPAELLLELLVQEDLNGWSAADTGLLGDLLFRLDVNLDALGLPPQFIQNALELRFEHVAGAAGG